MKQESEIQNGREGVLFEMVLQILTVGQLTYSNWKYFSSDKVDILGALREYYM